jgi:haloalkane dehalogenase
MDPLYSNADWLNRKEYPFMGKLFNQPMGLMHYLDEGSGDPIVMVHGNPGWSFEFRHLVKAMAGSHRCIVPDHIGFGFSEKPYSWDYLPQHHAENLERLLDHLNLQQITFVFNDWGGPIAMHYALKHPERVKHLVILNTWLWDVSDDKHFRRFSGFMGGAVGRFLIRNFNFFGKAVVKKAIANKKALTRDVHAHYYKHLPSARHRKGNYVFPKQIVDSGTWLNSLWVQREKLSHTKVSLIWGMKDIAFREKELLRWMEAFPNATVTRLPEVGHYPQEEAPDVVIAALKG